MSAVKYGLCIPEAKWNRFPLCTKHMLLTLLISLYFLQLFLLFLQYFTLRNSPYTYSTYYERQNTLYLLFLQYNAVQYNTKHRVCMGLGKPGKSWNFLVSFSRTSKRILVLERNGNLLNSSKKYEMYGRQ